MTKKRNSSQIATIILFIIAVIFLFTLMIINMGKVALKKTAVDNVADNVGLSVASSLGSIGAAVKYSLQIWGKSNERCDIDIKIIAGFFLVFVSLVVTVVTLGAGAPLAGAALLFVVGLGVSGALMAGGTMFANYIASNPKVAAEMRIKFQSMSQKQQIVEGAVMGVLMSLAEDPAYVIDRFDMDRDGDRADKVPRFMKWYTLRLAQIQGVGPYVKGFLCRLSCPGYSFFLDEFSQPRFWIVEDENWVASELPGYPDEYAKWWVPQTPGGTRNASPPAVILTDWIDGGLRELLSELRRYGYGINVYYMEVTDEEGNKKKVPQNITENPIGTYAPPPAGYSAVQKVGAYETDALDYWIDEIKLFERTMVPLLYNLDFDSAVQSADYWIRLFTNTANQDNKDWLRRLDTLDRLANDLRQKLSERTQEINNHLDACIGGGPWACGYGGGNCCECHWECCAYDEYGACTQNCPVCDSECGCGGGAGGGVFCPSSSPCPKPTYTPPGRPTCCQGAYNLHDQACAATTVCTGTNADCGASQCCDTYHACGAPPHSLNHITKANAVNILTAFINDLSQLHQLITKFDSDVLLIEAESLTRYNEAYYVWYDKVGGVSSQKQEVGHVAYVKIELPLTATPYGGVTFELPYGHTFTKNWGIKTCAGVEAAENNFYLTVGRYDEGTTKQGPLRKFWNFIFSLPTGISIENTVRNEGKRFDTEIMNSNFVEALPSITPQLKQALRNGQVTRIYVHYGPGNVQPKMDSVKASERNEDIRIDSTESKLP